MKNILLTLICTVLLQMNVCGELLYPWGSDNGDSQGPAAGGIHPIQMNNRIRFLRNHYYNISLCAGGRIGFQLYDAYNYWYPESFDCGDANIVPFGVMQDLSLDSHNGSPFSYRFNSVDFWSLGPIFSEKLWYRTTNDTDLLARAKADVRDNFLSCRNRFKPRELFIATWTDVHDIDFCEYRGYNDKMCDCVLNAPFLKDYPLGYSLGYSYYNPNDLYCQCVAEEEHPRACLCNLQYHYPYYMYALLLNFVNGSLCTCLRENYYDMDFCDCEVYGDCGMSKRSAVKREAKEINTYQVVIITNGRKQTFAMFNYESINWVYINTDLFQTHRFQFYGDPVRIYAEVGFEENDNKAYYHPYSGSDDLHKLVNDSNVGVPGRWMYRISGRKIQTPDCKRHSLG